MLCDHYLKKLRFNTFNSSLVVADVHSAEQVRDNQRLAVH